MINVSNEQDWIHTAQFSCSWFENSVPIFVQKMVLFALILLIIQHTESKHVCVSRNHWIK